MFRVGIGQDSHKFVSSNDKKPLMMGGILIPNQLGLEGNSDGDAVLHALFNALSSAVGGESIGVYSDPICLDQGITDSGKYLKIALEMISKTDLKVNNISIAIEAKKPRFSKDLTQKIRENIGKLCSIPENCVGITATSGEELTAFGKGEAIQVFTIVSLTSK